jgi:hypothetical protein
VATVDPDATEVRQVPTGTAGHVTAMQNELDYSVQPAPGGAQSDLWSSRHTLANHNDVFDRDYVKFPEPHVPRVEVTAEPRLDTQRLPNPGLFSSEASSMSKSQSRPLSLFNEITEDDVGNNKEFSSNLPRQPDSTQTHLLKAPVGKGNNPSQDRLSVSSIGDISTNSSGKKGLKHLWGSTKSRFKSQPASPSHSRSESPGATPPGRSRTSIAFKSEKTLDVLDTKVEYFQNVELHSSTTWEVIFNELMPLSAFGPMLNHLHRVFAAMDNIKTYR